MAFRDFGFPQVQHDLGLTVHDEALFPNVVAAEVRQEFLAFLRDGVTLAVANSTEKAKSEFIIAPMLLELRRSLGGSFALFSGVEWDADSSRGLNGYCDFLLTRGESQHVLGAPFAAVVEAKNDLIRTGLGQCIAAMVGAHVCNERAGVSPAAIHGVVSTGSAWKFLRLDGTALAIDSAEYYIDDVPRLMGVLQRIVRLK